MLLKSHYCSRVYHTTYSKHVELRHNMKELSSDILVTRSIATCFPDPIIIIQTHIYLFYQEYYHTNFYQ